MKNADAGHLTGLTNDITKQTSKTKQNHLYFLSFNIYIYIRISLLTMRSYEWVLIQYDLCPLKKRGGDTKMLMHRGEKRSF